MPLYAYKACNDRGKVIQGRMEAVHDGDLRSKIKELNLTVIGYRETKDKHVLGFLYRIGAKDKIMMCVQMQQLLKAGVPILEALADVRDAIVNPHFRSILGDIHEQVKAGTMLSAAFGKHTKVFDEVFTGLLAVGEKTANLPGSFLHLKNHIKWEHENSSKIKKALRYPAFMMVIMTGLIGSLMAFLVPQLTEFILGFSDELPILTRIMIAISNFCTSYGLYIIGIMVFGFITLKSTYNRSDTFKYKVDRLILKTPIIGDMVKKINISRYVHFFSITFSNGIEVLKCLNSAKLVVTNAVMYEAFDDIERLVAGGSRISNAMASRDLFPNLVVRMFKIGEDSGNVTDALENVNDFYDKEVDDAVTTMIGAIQPAMLVIMGTMLGLIVVAFFGPLYTNITKMF
jgi:type IV pilus assembly protein PilC